MAIVDAERLMSQIQGDIDLLEQLRVLYLEEIDESMRNLSRGFDDQNPTAIRSEIHKLNGVLANFMIASIPVTRNMPAARSSVRHGQLPEA